MMKRIGLNIASAQTICEILVTDEDLLISLIRKIKTLQYTRLVLVTNTVVWRLYGSQVASRFRKERIEYHTVVLPDGERYKNLKTLQNIFDALLACHADRGSLLVALGGGVIGDMTGFAAATYMRGIRYIQVPTTLLAQVDAAIGGKTGVDYASMKNMVGAFYQPVFIYSNVGFFKTLPDRIFNAGLAEVIKYGAIRDKDLFAYFGSHRHDILTKAPQSLLKIVGDSSRIKARFVEEDEKEVSGIRMLLNFGHTFGHALESLTQYKILHGEAVGIGMIVAARISRYLTLCKTDVPDQVESMVRGVGLPVSLKGLNREDLSKVVEYDKKNKGMKMRLVLLKKVGVPVIYETDKRQLHKLLMEVKI